MVFQCKDCQIWFRTQSKFDNHKNGSLGLRCSDNQDSFNKTQNLHGFGEDEKIEFEFPNNDEKKMEKKSLQSTHLDDVPDVSDEEKSMQSQSPNIQTHNSNNEDKTNQVVETSTTEDDTNLELVEESEDDKNSNTTTYDDNEDQRRPAANEGQVSLSETKSNNFNASGMGGDASRNISPAPDNSITLSDDESYSDDESSEASEASSMGPQLVCVHLDRLTLRAGGERRGEVRRGDKKGRGEYWRGGGGKR